MQLPLWTNHRYTRIKLILHSISLTVLPDFSLTSSEDPPDASLPQHTTWPAPQMAANAEKLATRAFTSFSWSFTALQSPPYFLSPQDITVPSLRIAAKARPEATISVTSFRNSLCPPKALPKSLWPQVTWCLQNTNHIIHHKHPKTYGKSIKQHQTTTQTLWISSELQSLHHSAKL